MSEKSAKRMRLGTRSCAECRRRRVRCVLPANGQVCEACRRHETRCLSQQPVASILTKDSPPEDVLTLQQRLGALESVVRELHVATLHSPRKACSSNGRTIDTSSLESDLIAAHTPPLDDATVLAGSDHAPLINLIKGASLVEILGAQSGQPSSEVKLEAQSAARTLNHFIPGQDTLRTVLELTEPYWCVWPAFYYGMNPSDRFRPGQSSAVISYIQNALASLQPSVIAKTVLWLALCFQQLPLLGHELLVSLPAPVKTLVEIYIREAKLMLTSSHLISDVESYLFLSKLYINAGKPRQAWLFARKGMSIALIQALHQLDVHADERRKYVWSQVWQMELNTSIILGMPWSLSVSHPAISHELCPSIPNTPLWYALYQVAGAIVERDQQRRLADYSVTVRIDQDWEKCLALVPVEWWNETPDPNLGFSGLYYRQVGKSLLFNIRKLAHIPYFMKARTDQRFEYSRIAALNASRQVIRVYRDLRESSVTQRVFCEVMDFQAFSAGMVLTVELLKDTAPNTTHYISDWILVETLASTLERASRLADCPVSAQGAHVLLTIIHMHRGGAMAPRRYEATIPYFGKVYLLRRQREASASPGCSTDQQFPLTGVDLNVDLFEHGSFIDFDNVSELAMDWTTLAEL